MAKIVIDASDVQNFIDDNTETRVTGFSWSEFRGITDVEVNIEVSDDLTFDDDRYVDVDVFDEVKNELEVALDEIAVLSEEKELLIAALDNANILLDEVLTEIQTLKAPKNKWLLVRDLLVK